MQRDRHYDNLSPLGSKEPQDTVCAGYAHMYKELCDRNGIKCDAVGGKRKFSGKSHGHAWNVVEIDDKKLLVDVQQAAVRKHFIDKNKEYNFVGENNNEYFGASQEKICKYSPYNGERDYSTLDSLTNEG